MSAQPVSLEPQVTDPEREWHAARGEHIVGRVTARDANRHGQPLRQSCVDCLPAADRSSRPQTETIQDFATAMHLPEHTAAKLLRRTASIATRTPALTLHPAKPRATISQRHGRD